MYDYNAIVLDNEIKMRFELAGPNLYAAYDLASGKQLDSMVRLDGLTIDCANGEVLGQYKLWASRPERAVGKLVQVEGANMEQLIDMYEEILVGAYIMSAKAASPTVTTLALLPNIKSTLDWLRSTDFYTAPASTVYHESFPGGLLVHSLKAYNQAMQLLNLNSFRSVPVEDAAITLLVHDWCKIGLYQSYTKRVKNEISGEWEAVNAYKREPKGLLLGHGATSMYLAQRCFNIKPEVAAAIRWHMASYDVSERDSFELYECNDRYPLVLLAQFADQLSVASYSK